MTSVTGPTSSNPGSQAQDVPTDETVAQLEELIRQIKGSSDQDPNAQVEEEDPSPDDDASTPEGGSSTSALSATDPSVTSDGSDATTVDGSTPDQGGSSPTTLDSIFKNPDLAKKFPDGNLHDNIKDDNTDETVRRLHDDYWLQNGQSLLDQIKNTSVKDGGNAELTKAITKYQELAGSPMILVNLSKVAQAKQEVVDALKSSHIDVDKIIKDGGGLKS